MVTDHKDKTFREGTIPLDDRQLEELARIMESLTDDELLSRDEAQIDRELFERFGTTMPERVLPRDPTSLNDDALWARLQNAQRPASGSKRSVWIPWVAAASLAAGLLLSLRTWQSDKAGESQFKGPGAKEGCELAYRADGMTVNLEAQGTSVPGSRSILFMARCQKEGYLRLELVAGSDRAVFPSIRVEKSGEFTNLTDHNQNPIGVMTPATGALVIHLSLSESPADEPLWKRSVQWPIQRQEAVP